MTKAMNHIISNFIWDTSFDDKARAFELQDRLSNWGKVFMPNEITGVFDQLCPSEQTWRIQSLQIDLGPIDFDDLEQALTEKLSRQLREKLIELVTNKKSEDTNVAILDEKIPLLDLLRSFFVNGLMPWTYKQIDGTLNQMLGEGLKSDRNGVIGMLTTVGRASENVRRRIAWQVDEPNITKIIEGLEPGNHVQIVSFSNDIVNLQQRKSVVQAGTAEFKKYLWFWVLNYLLNERGSLFNKIAFMQSSISQMAAHYNIAYLALLELIEQAANKLKRNDQLNADFMLILGALYKEGQLTNKKQKPGAINEADSWVALETHLRDTSPVRTNSQKIEFNELIIILNREDKGKFGALISKLDHSGYLWEQLVKELNEPAIETIFPAINASGSAIVLPGIHLLMELWVETGAAIERRVLWEISAKFLRSRQNTTFNARDFLSHCVSELSRLTGIKKVKILDSLTSAKISSRYKRGATPEIYHSLNSLFIAESAAMDIINTRHNFKILIDKLFLLLSSNPVDRELFFAKQKSVVKNIAINPARAIDALSSYPDKEKLKSLLPYIITDSTMQLLLQNLPKEIASVLLQWQHILNEFKAGNKQTGLAEIISENFNILALRAAVLSPGLRGADFLEFALQQFSGLVTAAELSRFVDFIGRVRSNNKAAAVAVMPASLNKISVDYVEENNLSIVDRAFQMLTRGLDSRAVIGKMLAVNFSDKAFEQLRFQGGTSAAKILNYLVKGGQQLMHSLVRTYTDSLIKESKVVAGKDISMLNEFFWRCILDFDNHGGKSEQLKKNFYLSVLFNFPITDKRTTVETVPVYITGGKNHRLEGGITVSGELLFSLIECCILNSTRTTLHEGQDIILSELIIKGLESNPSAVRKIFAKTAVSGERIEALKASVDFYRISYMLMTDSSGRLNDGIEFVRCLYGLLEDVLPGKITDDMVNAFWTQLWNGVQTGSFSSVGLKQLAEKTFNYIADTGGIKAEAVAVEIRKGNIQLTPSLSRVLEDCRPAFSKLLINQPVKLQDEKLRRAELKHLLYPLSCQVICQKQIPVWYGSAEDVNINDLLNRIVASYPLQLLQVFRHEIIPEPQMQWLSRSISFKELTTSIGRLERGKQPLLAMLAQLHEAFGHISVGGITAAEIQFLLFKKAIGAWLDHKWDRVSPPHIWRELLWDLCAKKGVSKSAFMGSVEKEKFRIPPALQISFEDLKTRNMIEKNVIDQKARLKPITPLLRKNEHLRGANSGIPLMNAGMVLLNSYFPMLFERVGLVSDKKFKDETARADAVHYLQYVVAGLGSVEEHLLPLNKVLCGLPLPDPVRDEITISDAHKDLMDGLIKAVIGSWPVIGNTSVDGFRGNWLVRNGLLAEQDDRWVLTVEKRAYDALIGKSPFSFSIIKYPWMDKPLYVNWPY